MPEATPFLKPFFSLVFVFGDIGAEIRFSAESVSIPSVSRAVEGWREGNMIFASFPVQGLLEPFQVEVSRATFVGRDDLDILLFVLQTPYELFFKTKLALYTSFDVIKGQGKPAAEYVMFPCVLTSISPGDTLSADDPDFVVERIEFQANFLLPIKS